MTLAFKIVGTVDVDTIDEACAALSRYMAPGAEFDEWCESDECPIGDLRFDWDEVAAVPA